ncbi:MAG: hypothetical protein PHR25_00240 [Clostridia bacterium]|nr:hypothetical protein [Clostridia bacterium]MDD4375203.1 hypothetical protein [Clostridia bacterium]
MKNNKGNILIMIFPIAFIFLIILISCFVFLHIQLLTGVLDIKESLFYYVQSSITNESIEELAYHNYYINEEETKLKLIRVLQENYNSKTSNIKEIEIIDFKLLQDDDYIYEHTKGKYNKEVIHVEGIIYIKPIFSFLGERMETYFHDDIKINTLNLQ